MGIVPDGITMPIKPGSAAEHCRVAAVNEPKRITSWEEFKANFGDFQAGNKTLAQAVYGFFNNGGRACWVARVTGAADCAAGLDTLKAIDEIAIVAVPGLTDGKIQEKVLAHCESMKDRFAILDGKRTAKFTKNDITDGLRYAEEGCGAIYFPWIEVLDPVTQRNDFLPPSGHIAGIYARCDAERGVHKAPANEVIRGAVGLENRLSRADQDALNSEGINVIRVLNGNVTVWGARTWINPGSHPEWKYVNARRLFAFVRISIEAGTRWVVFEPNDRGLWQNMGRDVTAFLSNEWRKGALPGATPEQAFYVKCDEETNPPEVRDLGQVVMEIGVAIVKPAEFVVFRIRHGRE